MVHKINLEWVRSSDKAALTRTEVAELFGVDARTVTVAVERGEIPCVRFGRRVLIPREPLLAMLTSAALLAPDSQGRPA